MSFVNADDIISLIERMLAQVWKKVLGIDLTNKIPFQRMNFNGAMSKVTLSNKVFLYHNLLINVIFSFFS